MNKTPNERLFEELYIKMRSKLLIFAEAKIPDKENAEDIVEETFKTAWQKISEIAASNNPHGWLVNALKLHILKHFEKRNIEHSKRSELCEIKPQTETFFDNEISFRGSLSSDEMQILKLKEAGYKHNEISTIMDLPEGTIHSKVSRIKGKLKKLSGVNYR